MPTSTNQELREGDWFQVPLADGASAVGRLARLAHDGGVAVAYFFAPVSLGTGDAWQQEVEHLRPEASLHRLRFGTAGIASGKWKVLLPRLPWDRTAWPLPAFVTVSPLSGVATKVEYDESDLQRMLSQQVVSAEVAQSLPQNALCSHKAVERRLTQALNGDTTSASDSM